MTNAPRSIWGNEQTTGIRLCVDRRPKPPVPSAVLFIITMIIGIGFAMGLERSGLGFKAGFACGVGYMLAAALVINSSARR